jgi:hypothetical protein
LAPVCRRGLRQYFSLKHDMSLIKNAENIADYQ